MTDSSILQSRTLALLDEIEQARVALDRIKALAPELHVGVAPRFEQTLTAQERRLTDSMADLGSDPGIARGWTDTRLAREKLGPVLRDIHAFAQGAAARQDGMDRGLLRLADALLNELGGASEYKARITVLADREFYGELAEMIRLRFPDTALWVLPVVGHEFAHFLARNLRIAGTDTFPLDAIVRRGGNEAERFRLEELIGDMFATYALGPAYGLMCLVLRFDVEERTLPTHPSNSVRIEAILRTLQRAPSTKYGHPYRTSMKILRNKWHELRGSDRIATTENETADLSLLDTHFQSITQAFEDAIPQARYDTFRKAESLVPTLEDGSWQGLHNPNAAITDILNAMWLARLAPSQDESRNLETIELAGRSLIDRIIQTRAAPMQPPVGAVVGGRR
jgi:hypothetical protein